MDGLVFLVRKSKTMLNIFEVLTNTSSISALVKAGPCTKVPSCGQGVKEIKKNLSFDHVIYQILQLKP